MAVRYILYSFTIASIRTQTIDFFPDERSHIVWEDAKLKPSNDYIAIWNKEMGPKLRFPKILFPEEKLPQKLPALQWQKPVNIEENKETIFLNQNEKENVVTEFKNTNDVQVKNIEVTRPPKDEKEKTSDEENLVKDKIFQLAQDTERDLSSKVQAIEKTHELFKHNSYYKLGFLTSYINTTHHALVELVKYVGRNKDDWDVLKVLNAYVQIKRTKEFLTEMLATLAFIQSRQSMAMPLSIAEQPKKRVSSIAWSYYDDDH